VDIYGGQGTYRSDSVAKAVMFRGFDWANMVSVYRCPSWLAPVPAGPPERQLILAAIFTYIAYNYLIGVMGNGFNGLFLVWTALFSAGAFGSALTIAEMTFSHCPTGSQRAFPGRALPSIWRCSASSCSFSTWNRS